MKTVALFRCALFAALWCLISSPSGAANGEFQFKELNDRSLGLFEGGKPVLVYNFGVITNASAPSDRARSSYVHPLYGLDGEVLTDDFPKDHYHHRGLFWAWPHVIVDGKETDLWMLKGIQPRFEKWLEREARTNRAILAVQNGWYTTNGTRVLEETVRLRIGPAKADTRIVDVDLTLKPVGKPVTLRGAEGKSYGGLTLRFAPGTNTVITIPSGVTPQDLPVTNLPWADLTRLLAGNEKPSGAAIFVARSHPDYPPEWLTRHYGVLCLGWPGVRSQTLAPDQPVRFSYRVWIHRGPVTTEQIAAAYEEFAGPSGAQKQ